MPGKYICNIYATTLVAVVVASEEISHEIQHYMDSCKN